MGLQLHRAPPTPQPVASHLAGRPLGPLLLLVPGSWVCPSPVTTQGVLTPLTGLFLLLSLHSQAILLVGLCYVPGPELASGHLQLML